MGQMHITFRHPQLMTGFKDRNDGHFTEVMLIKSPEDEALFKEIYRLDEVKTEY